MNVRNSTLAIFTDSLNLLKVFLFYYLHSYFLTRLCLNFIMFFYTADNFRAVHIKCLITESLITSLTIGDKPFITSS